MPMLPSAWNNSVAQASLMPPASSPERYIELWWYSGASASSTATTSGTATSFIKKGTTTTGAAVSIKDISGLWPATLKYWFEATIYNGTASDITYLALYDISASALVSASQISVTATTATVVRSGQFSLIPGHSYGLTLWCNAGTAYATDASLIAIT